MNKTNTPVDDARLLPCPACNRPANRAKVWGTHADRWTVECSWIRCGFMVRPCVSQAEADAFWNARVEFARRDETDGEVCGNGVIAGRFLVGCDRPFKVSTDIFRCFDCGVPFHQECLKRHCKENFLVSSHSSDLSNQDTQTS